MSLLKRFSLALAAVALMAITAAASVSQTPAVSSATPQTTTAATPANVGDEPTYVKPETPEQRKQRVGTAVDPGPDPDPKQIFYRFGNAFRIEKFERKWAAYDQPAGWVRPMAQVNAALELYQQNSRFVWCWVPEPSLSSIPPSEQGEQKAESAQEKSRLAEADALRKDFADLMPADAQKTIRFEESSTGLPDSGSWRNSLTVADMNGDGFLDIIAPPQRGVLGGTPAIFLGDGKGHWKYWAEATWPAQLDYGAVVAADFNGDGHMDVAFSIHLTGVRAFLGDGKGHFRESSKGLPVASFPTRKLLVADVDKDGRPDLLAISEGASLQGAVGGAKVRAFLNRNKGTSWEEVAAVGSQHTFAGDSLAIGNFNGDAYPDFVGGSVYFQAGDLIYVSEGKKKWKQLESDVIVPTLASYYGVTTGHFTSRKLDDAVVTFSRRWPSFGPGVTPPEHETIGGIDLISFNGAKPTRTPLVRFSGGRPIMGITTGDFDGDGNLDIVYAAWEPKREFVILLGDGKGGFKRARLEGIPAAGQTNYDLTVADVNGDGRPDIIVAYESDKQGKMGAQTGSIHVFLNRGASKTKPAEK